ncbi:sperm-associated antigen 16 protein-like [Rhopilema esculentum]|uniref:sperm-associated antigen 16 protein-like n=1 Tax=Rhopilema esculentum TaxID=499914 RepID=UPI0031D5C681
MATLSDDGPYYLEKESLPGDPSEEFLNEQIPDEDDFALSDEEEDLQAAVKALNEQNLDENLLVNNEEASTIVNRRPEVVEDFVRNFLVKTGMHRTLDCFQTEWYELKMKGLLQEEKCEIVPDIYIRNQQLEDSLRTAHREADSFREAARKASNMHIKLKKERDYHRMHHKRVVQEKDRLIADIKRLKQHYASYEPTLKTLKHKYEVAMKEKLLTKLERDRAVGQVQGLQSTLSQIEVSKINVANASTSPMKKPLTNQNGQPNTSVQLPPPRAHHPLDSEFPPDKGVNPYLSKNRAPCAHLTRTGGFRLTNTVSSHDLAVSGLCLHPRKQVLASVSDDNTWKLWAIPSGDIIMTGEGHEDWLSDCDFHPSGSKLATSSGDTTVKIWDFAQAKCVETFAGHTQAVWGCSFHSCGDFLASCSMDGTSKIWDLNSTRCRNTLRGHADSVNSIMFLPFSNTLCTCSADKTVSLWDARTGLCAQTLYGHVHSINHVIFNNKGDMLASCDSYGIVRLWDIRTTSVLKTLDFGPHPSNRVAFDPSTSVLAIASNDGMVKMYDIAGGNTASLTGHEDAVQDAVFDRNGEFLISGASDGTIRIWS